MVGTITRVIGPDYNTNYWVFISIYIYKKKKLAMPKYYSRKIIRICRIERYQSSHGPFY